MTLIFKKLFCFFAVFFILQKTFSQGVAINTDGSIPHQSAMLDVKSDRRGVLLPKVSLVALNNGAPITSPATGLIVYNTNLNLPGGAGYFYNAGDENNVDWKRLATGNNNNDGWLLTGNAGTNDAINFMGTTDNQNVVFKRGGVKALEIYPGGTLLATGDDNGVVPISGPGTRMMFLPAKKAFRVGHVEGSQWDENNIGVYSFASGWNCIANGHYSFAMGAGSTAEENFTFAFGHNSHSSGEYAIAMGLADSAKGSFSVAIGKSARAIGTSSIALGTALALGSTSFAVGNNAQAYGDASFAIGHYAVAKGYNSIAFGRETNAVGTYSFAMGWETTADALNGVAIGRFNEKQFIQPNNPFATDKVFQIGDGIDKDNRKDIFYIRRNGYTYVGGNAYVAGNMSVIGNAKIVGNVEVDGWVCAQVACPSDIRLKENIAPLQNALNSIEHIQPISYNFKDKEKYPSTHQIGFNAQEIEKAFPELVVKNKNGYLAVNYPQMSAIAIQAAKEQQAIIKNQQEQINNLEGKVKSQEQINNNLQEQITELKKIIKDK